jgi:hypothetical protein
MNTEDWHDCPKTGCSRRVSRQYLACRAHWSQVSRPTQSAVYVEFALWSAGQPNDYPQIRDQAIAEMNHPDRLPAKELRS